MTQKAYARSFAGGEIAPLMFGRLDLGKFQTGLQKCLNFEVTPQGPAESRPGFEFVNTTNTQGSVLIPFVYSSDQSFAIEFGGQYIRFHTDGGTLLEPAKAIAGISVGAPGVFNVPAHGYAINHGVFLATIGGMTSLTARWATVRAVIDANNVTLNDMFGNPINTTGLPAYTGGGTIAHIYTISSPYLIPDLLNLHYVQSADVLTITHQNYPVQELRRLGATNWTMTAPSFVPTIATPAVPTASTGGPGGGTATNHTYATTAIAAGTLEESLASASVTVSSDLTVAGNFNDVQTAIVAGAIRYNVYELQSGIYGYVGQTDGSSFRDTNITPDLSKTPPLASNPFAAENPQAVSYFEQRRCFGGSGVDPQTMWATRSGTESNMTYSIPTQDDDAITARIVAREANAVRHLVPLNDLLAFTSGGVWRVAASDGGALTPATFSAKPHSYVGASMVQPVVTSASVLFAPNRGSRIREVSFQWQTQRYQADDVSVLAPHLVDYFGVRQIAYSSTPNQILWAVRSDGQLLGLTYQPEHDVRAWHQHSTRGVFKSVCVIPEGDEDGIYAIIERTINGQTMQYIERKHSRKFSTLADAFFVDSGATYRGAPTSTVTGLWHLEGESVVALADGGVEPVQAVTNGTIALQAPASTVHVGLAYNCDLQTLPLSLEGVAAFGQGATKNINGWAMRVLQSSGIRSGPSFDDLREYPQRTQSDNYGSAPGMISGVVRMKLSPQWQEDGSLCVRQANPLPLTVLSLAPEVAVGG